MLDHTSSTRRKVTSGMSATALNAASSGLTVVSLLLPDFEHPTTPMATRIRRILSTAALFICNALCKSAPTVAPVIVLEGSLEAYEKFHRAAGDAKCVACDMRRAERRRCRGTQTGEL